MICSHCGSENADGSQFCRGCGAALAAPAPTQPLPVQPAAAPTYAPAPAQPAGYAPPPAAAAPPYAPAAQVYAPPPAPKKKKRGCVIALSIVGFLMLCCVGSAAAAYFGFLSIGKPRDLGVRYTEKDYQSAVTKMGIDVSQADPSDFYKGNTSGTAGSEAGASGGAGTNVGTAGGATGGGTNAGTAGGGTNAGATGGGAAGGTAGGGTATKPPTGTKGSAAVTEGPAKGTKVVYEGSVPIDIYLTSAEFSALISMHHYSPNWLVQDLQVKFGENGQIELSGYVVYEGRLYGGYAQVTGQLTGPRSVGGSIQVLEGLGFEVPEEYNEPAAEYLAGVMNSWLAQMDGLNLTQATIEGGQLHLVGTVPGRVVRVPADQ